MNLATIPRPTAYRAKAFFVVLILFFCTHCFCQYPGAKTGLRFQHYTTKDGLSENNVLCLFQDSRGLIWVGTRSGLNYFDGKNFVAFYPSESGMGLYSDEIARVAEDSGHNILFRTNDGVEKLNWETKTIALVTPGVGTNLQERVQDFFIDDDKNIWLLSGTTLERHDRQFNKLKSWPIRWGGFQNRFVLGDSWKNIWFVDNDVLHKLDVKNNTLTNIFSDDKCYKKLFDAYRKDMAEDKDGNIWAISEFTLYRFNRRKNELDSFNSPVPGLGLLAIAGNGQINITTTSYGILTFDLQSKKFRQCSSNPADPYSPNSNYFVTILKDNNGNMWLGSKNGLDKSIGAMGNFFVADGFGISVLGEGENRSFNKPDMQKPVICGNKVFIPTTYGEFVMSSDNLSMRHYRADEKLASGKDFYWANFMLAPGQMLATTWPGLLLFNTNGKKLTPLAFTMPHPYILDSTSVVSIFEDSGNNLWMAMWGDSGLVKWNRSTNEFTRYSKYEKGNRFFPLRHFNTAAEDDSGNIFMAYDKGGIKVFNKRLQIFTPLPLPQTDRINKDRFYGLLNDRRGNIWMATADGLVKYSLARNNYHRFTKLDGLASAGVADLALDKNGRLWMATLSGISCLQIADNRFTNYNQLDGLPEDELVNLVFDSLSNRMYYTTINTFGFFCPDSLNKAPIPLKPLITSFKIAGKDVPVPAAGVVVHPTENAFSLGYTCPNFINPADTRYAYRLQGFDKDWVNAGGRQYVDYTDLPGGDYTFTLKASTDGVHWYAMKNDVNIHVIVPFYQSLWFYVIILAAAFGILLLILLVSQRMKIKRLLALQKIRNNIAGDLHDDIGSSLSSIMLMGEVAQNQPAQANRYLSQITESARKIIENMNDIVWAVNPDNDTVEQVLVRMQAFAAALLEKKNIHLRFEVSAGVEKMGLRMDERKNFYLIFKEAIHNAFKYAECKQVAVQLGHTDKTVTLKIQDDGKGFDTTKKYMGNGLYNIKRRAAEIKGSLQIISAPGRGTTILLVFKITQTGRYVTSVKN